MENFETKSGVRIAYSLAGKLDDDRKGDLVFFNGLFAGIPNWLRQHRCPYFKKNYGIILFDYRCQGKSEAVETSFDFDDVVRDVVELLASLKLERPVFICHSLGGIISLLVAHIAQNSEELSCQPEGMILANTGACVTHRFQAILHEVHNYMVGNRLIGKTESDAFKGLSPNEIFRMVYPFFFGDSYVKKLIGYEAQVINTYEEYNSPKALGQLLDSIFRRNEKPNILPEIASKNTCPTLVLSSDEDVIFPLKFSSELASLLPKSELVVLDNVGHTSQVEDHRRFNQAVENFLKQIHPNE